MRVTPNPLPASHRRPSDLFRRIVPGSRPALPLVVGLLAGFGSVLAGASFVRAADEAGVFEVLRQTAHLTFGAPAALRAPAALQAPVPSRPPPLERLRPLAPPVSAPPTLRAPGAATAPPRPVPLRYASLPASGAAPSASPGASAIPLGRRSVCVRLCDGYAFPLGNLVRTADMRVHRTGCEASCPGAETALYTLPAGSDDLARAVGLDGRPYSRLPTASLHLTRRVPACACQVSAASPVRLPWERDETLRPGDIVTAATRPLVFAGARRFEPLAGTAALGARARREADRVLDISRRARINQDFRRALQARRQERNRQIAMAQADPLLRVPGFQVPGFQVLSASTSFSLVRVVVPSPYGAN